MCVYYKQKLITIFYVIIFALRTTLGLQFYDSVQGEMIERMKTARVSVKDGGKTAGRRENREVGKPTENR